mmetsp:Transcript_27617/g.80036  ORF Transcript_27617/g.80036 Transcript_27617/m.80036 type:complete len:235 (-) Transcript_27617:480-1184(-)
MTMIMTYGAKTKTVSTAMSKENVVVMKPEIVFCISVSTFCKSCEKRLITTPPGVTSSHCIGERKTDHNAASCILRDTLSDVARKTTMRSTMKAEATADMVVNVAIVRKDSSRVLCRFLDTQLAKYNVEAKTMPWITRSIIKRSTEAGGPMARANMSQTLPSKAPTRRFSMSSNASARGVRVGEAGAWVDGCADDDMLLAPAAVLEPGVALDWAVSGSLAAGSLLPCLAPGASAM